MLFRAVGKLLMYLGWPAQRDATLAFPFGIPVRSFGDFETLLRPPVTPDTIAITFNIHLGYIQYSSATNATTTPRLHLTTYLHSTPQHPPATPSHPTTMISGIHHINLTVPPSTLPAASAFYAATLGLTPLPVPSAQSTTLLWFAIGTSGQQVHIAIGRDTDFSSPISSRHACFRVESVEALEQLRERIWGHFEQGGEGAPREADKPGEKASGAVGVEYPKRFFAR